MNEEIIKLRIRRFNAHDQAVLQKMGTDHKITWADIERIAESMKLPHRNAINNINQHLWELANLGVEKPNDTK